jgi:alpha-glucosidase (family GH31 glycosyl hydrolase)
VSGRAFVPESRYYDTLLKNGWFEHLSDGTPTNGLPYDRAGSDIDTTNPDAALWYWNAIRDNFVSKGFDAFWADETEPDLPPNGSYLHIGPGTEYFNVYPYFHTKALYDGFRTDLTDRRALILSRDAYLGAQHNGAIFWSSDIAPTWDTLKRQIPTGLNFVEWTNERMHGGQRIKVSAPIDTLPIFVRAGSILPLGAPIESTNEKQAIAKLRVYRGADGDFTLYNDDGTTYAYETGRSKITHLHWSDASGKLQHSGAQAWDKPDESLLAIIGSREEN